MEQYLWFSHWFSHKISRMNLNILCPMTLTYNNNKKRVRTPLCCIIFQGYLEKDYGNVHTIKLSTMVESCNCEPPSRRLPWGWELTVSSFWLAYLFKCSARNLCHTNRSKNFIIITIATAGKFISKQSATSKFFQDGKESRWCVTF